VIRQALEVFAALFLLAIAFGSLVGIVLAICTFFRRAPRVSERKPIACTRCNEKPRISGSPHCQSCDRLMHRPRVTWRPA
jgi:hypothetical protein